MAIMHGGMNGINEALYNGVPVISLPLGGDQGANAGRLQHHGLGIQLNQQTLTSEAIKESVNRIESENYREKAASIRKMFLHAGGPRGLQIWWSSMRRSGMSTWFQPMPSMSGAGCSTTMWMCMPCCSALHCCACTVP